LNSGVLVRNCIVKAALDHYKIISRDPLLAQKVLEVLTALITPSTIVRSEKPTVPRKIIGTLTSNMLNSMHTLMTPIFMYKSCSIATTEHSKPILLENCVRIVAIAPDLWTVSIYNAIEFLYRSSTIKLLSLLILMKRLFPTFRTSLLC
jgi:hypothetical protein